MVSGRMLGLALAVGLGLSACATPIRHAECANAGASLGGSTGIYGPLGLMKSDEQVACDRRYDYLKSQPSQQPPVLRAVTGGEIFVGMPSEAAQSAWGPPDHVKRSSTGTDQWVYGYPTKRGFHTTGIVDIRDGRVVKWRTLDE
jgi:hypothetical protein